MELTDIVSNNRITIIVKPNAKKTEIIEYREGIVKIAVAAPADKDKANKELLHFVSRLLRKHVRFVSGLKSKKKVLEIVA
jgi:uncharacterized protein (TIGR00251 family)